MVVESDQDLAHALMASVKDGWEAWLPKEQRFDVAVTPREPKPGGNEREACPELHTKRE